MLLRRVLSRPPPVMVFSKYKVLRRVLRRVLCIEGASKVLRRQKHVLSQSTTPSRAPYLMPTHQDQQDTKECLNQSGTFIGVVQESEKGDKGGGEEGRSGGRVNRA